MPGAAGCIAQAADSRTGGADPHDFQGEIPVAQPLFSPHFYRRIEPTEFITRASGRMQRLSSEKRMRRWMLNSGVNRRLAASG